MVRSWPEAGGWREDRAPLRGDAPGDGRAQEAERGRYGAYTLRPSFTLPPMMFTDEEALALASGCSRPAGSACRGPPLPSGARAAGACHARGFARAGADLRGGRRPWPRPRRAAGEVVVTLSGRSGSASEVRMRYRAGDSGETRRDVDPCAVVRGNLLVHFRLLSPAGGKTPVPGWIGYSRWRCSTNRSYSRQASTRPRAFSRPRGYAGETHGP